MLSPTLWRQDSSQDVVNGRLYRRADLVRSYANWYLTPPEATALVRYRDDIANRRVLDLGCGAGRLAAYLRPLTTEYVGLDISPHMIEHCRRNFPGFPFVQGDMRALSFSDESFDAVFAVFNLFDAVCHDDRLQALAEARRVLVPGGLLVFSSHNRNRAGLAAPPRLQLSRNPVRQFRCLVEYIQACVNHQRIKPHERFEPDYALVNDAGHNYSVLHYYISRHAQVAQLSDIGLRVLECLDESGRPLGPEDDDSACSSLHYIARREE